jgi:4,5-DOPA dioxygenase extradiol
MPTLFIGHGDPMNALKDNAFTRSLAKAASALPARPLAVLAISAHWCEGPVAAGSTSRPETIHDFYGFPSELYEVEYPAPGAPEVAQRLAGLIPGLGLDATRGLDHGAWAVLRHLFPSADIPVLQLSLDLSRSFEEHLELGRALAPLRDEGILILGSGNIVHNLRLIRWDGEPFPWALEFDAWAAQRIASRDYAALTHPEKAAFALAAPTVEHYVPLLYTLGAAGEDPISTIYEGIEHGSLSMRCLRCG